MEDLKSNCCQAERNDFGLCAKCEKPAKFQATFALTQEQITEINDCNFTPNSVIVGVNDTPQLRAEIIWKRIANEEGFDVETVEPLPPIQTVRFRAKVVE